MTENTFQSGPAYPELGCYGLAGHTASPRDLVVLVDESSQKRITAVAPFVAPLVAKGGAATAYVCVERACHAPTTDPAELTRDLRTN